MNRRHLLIGGGAVATGAAAVGLGSWVGMGRVDQAKEAANTLRGPLPIPAQDRDLIRHATLAANGHNTQPWRFRVRDTQIDILPDFTRRTPVVDPDDHHLFVSLGCAAENLSLAAAAAEVGGDLDLLPDGAVTFTKGANIAAEPELAAAIPFRQSTRSEYDGGSISTADLRSLEEASAIPGVEMALITDRPQMDSIRDLILDGNRRQMTDGAFMDELKQWIRFSPAEAIERGDGLFAAASGNPLIPEWLGRAMFRFVVTADGENDRYARQMASSSGLVAFFAAQEGRQGWLAVGRACQRFQLKATTLGIRSAYVNQPVEVVSLQSELASATGRPGKRPDLLLRFGRAPLLPYSLRRPVEDVLA